MNRTKQLKYNAFSSLTNQIVTVISSLILPRMILLYYGSSVNGLISSINQFLVIITFLELGVGIVVQSSLYTPLANNDFEKTSLILLSAQRYFKKIALILVGYVILLIFSFPIIINQNLSFIPTALLIISISISKFSQYYFGIVNELLLNADQKGHIHLIAEAITIILNLIISIILIVNGMTIQNVQLLSSIIFLIRPIYLNWYVHKNYDINHNIEIKEEPIKQKWHGMAYHLAWTIQNSSAIIVLSFFSSLNNVSIYSIYSMVVNGIKMILQSITNGLSSFYGNLLANNEIVLLKSYFSRIEWIIHSTVTFLFSMTLVLINQFVLIYTSGISDTNYYAPVFSIILVLSQAIYSLIVPYQNLILAAGHFKQTQISSYIEVAINLILSILLVSKFGLVGTSIGTLIAAIFRILYVNWYLSNNIIYRSPKLFFKQICVNTIIFVVILWVSSFLKIETLDYIQWFKNAVILGGISLVCTLIINMIFYRENTKEIINRLFKIR
ncbi:sugar isomerase [Fundicoccus sp. Sow4_D5]|uniref:sugar isomerase n=1 Tax=Fundicoccus sp. Sow4_D5 TaxID=3438782 RepID=UPI003F906E35